MKTLIVYAHPSKKSFTYQLFSQLKKGIIDAGHPLKISDLYAMNFQSDMTESEYDREGFANKQLPIPVDVALEQQKIEWADTICFVYPVWWSDCPAKLKGWFDRVYTVGYAYGYNEQGNAAKKMSTKKKGIVICPAGHPNAFLNEIGMAQSMRKVMLEDRLGKRFEQKEMHILGGTLDLEQVKVPHLNTAYAIGKNISFYR